MDIFQEVKNQLNIRQVIEHYGIKIHRNNQFKCVFHNDHKPSASIKKDYFHCFVCGAGGDLITFTAQYLGMSNLDAAKELIKEFNLNIDISTQEEQKARHIAEQKRKAEIKSCNSLRDKFAKDKQIRSESRKYTDYKLRNEVRQINKKNEEEQEAYIHHAGLVLADFHRFLWQGIYLYPYEHERHIRGLQEITVCEYYLDCYDTDAVQFVKIYMEVIKEYERELDSINKQK